MKFVLTESKHVPNSSEEGTWCGRDAKHIAYLGQIVRRTTNQQKGPYLINPIPQGFDI
jgi:hypothetical protein